MKATAQQLYSKLPAQVAALIETSTYGTLSRLTHGQYKGGLWNYRVDNNLAITALLLSEDNLTLHNDGAYISLEVNAKVASAVALVITLNKLSWHYAMNNKLHIAKMFSDFFYKAKDASLDLLNEKESSQFLQLID
ncbi:hypothetical protein tloyanaT_13280 [Thalassotalea loyana]|uniref:Antirestriction protein n=1 Tax=Thalassotalea loyana TaxID=280483 RepID=A0ABQ6HAC7_9GAMM|nr:hypothetical protein [Thalassotalea loyana]GLX85076.1 hypothetical protein tloyanaT_13280 [Thalassotalea loyana]